MKTFKQVVDALVAELAAHPELADLPCVHTDDQCLHTEIYGFVFAETSDDWPDEFCLQDDINGAFVRIA